MSIVGRLLFPRKAKLEDSLSNAVAKSVEEIGKFDESVKLLSIGWLGVNPEIYFSYLFLKGGKTLFTNAFNKSGIVDVQESFTITQAYFLRHLKEIIKNDQTYSKFSINELEENILLKMTFGDLIIQKAVLFEKFINNMLTPEDFVMVYVEEVMKKIYPDEEKRKCWISKIQIDYASLLGLFSYTNEKISIAKKVDIQTGII